MENSLGMVEYRTVSTGMRAADLLVKTAGVYIISAQTVCPGKYMVIISGELSAIKAACDASKTAFAEGLIDSFILGNPHPDIYKALTQTSEVENIEALGIIETFTSASCVVAADIVSKAAVVRLVEIRLARGMCGKSYVLYTGSIASVTEATEIALKNLKESTGVVDYAVIPRPDERFWKTLL